MGNNLSKSLTQKKKPAQKLNRGVGVSEPIYHLDSETIPMKGWKGFVSAMQIECLVRTQDTCFSECSVLVGGSFHLKGIRKLENLAYWSGNRWLPAINVPESVELVAGYKNELKTVMLKTVKEIILLSRLETPKEFVYEVLKRWSVKNEIVGFQYHQSVNGETGMIAFGNFEAQDCSNVCFFTKDHVVSLFSKPTKKVVVIPGHAMDDSVVLQTENGDIWVWNQHQWIDQHLSAQNILVDRSAVYAFINNIPKFVSGDVPKDPLLRNGVSDFAISPNILSNIQMYPNYKLSSDQILNVSVSTTKDQTFLAYFLDSAGQSKFQNPLQISETLLQFAIPDFSNPMSAVILSVELSTSQQTLTYQKLLPLHVGQNWCQENSIIPPNSFAWNYYLWASFTLGVCLFLLVTALAMAQPYSFKHVKWAILYIPTKVMKKVEPWIKAARGLAGENETLLIKPNESSSEKAILKDNLDLYVLMILVAIFICFGWYDILSKLDPYSSQISTEKWNLKDTSRDTFAALFSLHGNESSIHSDNPYIRKEMMTNLVVIDSVPYISDFDYEFSVVRTRSDSDFSITATPLYYDTDSSVYWRVYCPENEKCNAVELSGMDEILILPYFNRTYTVPAKTSFIEIRYQWTIVGQKTTTNSFKSYVNNFIGYFYGSKSTLHWFLVPLNCVIYETKEVSSAVTIRTRIDSEVMVNYYSSTQLFGVIIQTMTFAGAMISFRKPINKAIRFFDRKIPNFRSRVYLLLAFVFGLVNSFCPILSLVIPCETSYQGQDHGCTERKVGFVIVVAFGAALVHYLMFHSYCIWHSGLFNYQKGFILFSYEYFQSLTRPFTIVKNMIKRGSPSLLVTMLFCGLTYFFFVIFHTVSVFYQGYVMVSYLIGYERKSVGDLYAHELPLIAWYSSPFILLAQYFGLFVAAILWRFKCRYYLNLYSEEYENFRVQVDIMDE